MQKHLNTDQYCRIPIARTGRSCIVSTEAPKRIRDIANAVRRNRVSSLVYSSMWYFMYIPISLGAIRLATLKNRPQGSDDVLCSPFSTLRSQVRSPSTSSHLQSSRPLTISLRTLAAFLLGSTPIRMQSCPLQSQSAIRRIHSIAEVRRYSCGHSRERCT